MPINLLLVEAYTVMRHGLRLLLEEDPEILVIGEAGTKADTISLALDLSPSLILIDPDLPDAGSIQTIRQLRSALPAVPLIILTASQSSDEILAAFKAGVKGYLLKDITGPRLIESIHQVAAGESILPITLTGCLLEELAEPSPSPEILTDRELDVLACVTQGLGNKEIACILNISQNTVKTHVRRILAKLHLRSRTEAATFALQRGVPLPSCVAQKSDIINHPS